MTLSSPPWLSEALSRAKNGNDGIKACLPLAPHTHGNLRCPPGVGSPQLAPLHPDGPVAPPPPQKLPKDPHLRPETKSCLLLATSQTDGAGLDTSLGSCKSKNVPGHAHLFLERFFSVQASTSIFWVFLVFFYDFESLQPFSCFLDLTIVPL